MKGYLVELGGSLEPWGDRVGALPVANRPLGQWSEDALRAAGCDVIERVSPEARLTGPAFVLADDLWLTPALARRFAQAVRGAAERRALALPSGPLVEFSLPLQTLTAAPEGWGYPLAWLPPGGEAAACAWEGAALEVIPVQHDAQELPIHRALVPEGRLVVPFGDESAMRLEHWMHLLRANQLALLAWGAHQVRREPWRLLWAALRALSFNKHRVMARMGSRGRGCDVHPTAVVEASVLGDGVRVGAHAVVRFSHLGDRASVSDLACVESSVLGAGAVVARTAFLQGCVLMEGASTGFPGVQLSVLGEGAFTGGAVLLADFKPGGNVQVRHRGVLVDSGSPLLGCAVGHRTRLLMGLTFYPGRAIPNALTILGPTEHVVSRIRSDLPTDRLLVARGGGIEPLGGAGEG